MVGEVDRVLSVSSMVSDHTVGRLLRPLCTPEYIVTLWWLCHSQPLVPTDGGLRSQKPCNRVTDLSPGLRCCYKETNRWGFMGFENVIRLCSGCWKLC